MLVSTSEIEERSNHFEKQEMKTMFKLINMKTIGAAAISMSLILGTLAGPVSTAFAKGSFNKSFILMSTKGSTLHLHRNVIRVDQGKEFVKSYHLGNRSIGY
jgi:hypothetical protein